MMMMMKERIFAGQVTFLLLFPLHFASLALALLALNLLLFAPLTKTAKCELKRQNAS